MRLASLQRFARTRSALRGSGLLALTLALGPFGLGCELVPGVDDAAAPDGHVQEPAGAGSATDAASANDAASAAEAALDAGLDAASRSDAMAQAAADATALTPASDGGDAQRDAHTDDTGLGDAGARTSDAAAQDASTTRADATATEAGANDAAANDAAMIDSGPSVPPGQSAPNATATRFVETGRTCYQLSGGSKASQVLLCQAELCGPLQVEMQLTGLTGGQFEVLDCTPFDPSTPLADVPITLDLSSTGGSLRVLFDGALRSLPLTAENMRAHAMWGEFTYVGAHTNQPSSAQAYFDSTERVPVEIVDYRDELLHLKMEYVHPGLSYSELSDGFPCETPPSPFPGICKELYCSYVPGTGAGRTARTARLDAIARLPARYCP